MVFVSWLIIIWVRVESGSGADSGVGGVGAAGNIYGVIVASIV